MTTSPISSLSLISLSRAISSSTWFWVESPPMIGTHMPHVSSGYLRVISEIAHSRVSIPLRGSMRPTKRMLLQEGSRDTCSLARATGIGLNSSRSTPGGMTRILSESAPYRVCSCSCSVGVAAMILSADWTIRSSFSIRTRGSCSSSDWATVFFILPRVWNMCRVGSPQCSRSSCATQPDSQ